MTHARNVLVASVAALAIAIASCSSSSSTQPGPGAADGGDGSAPATTWTTSPCGTCDAAACAPARQVCDSEPSCAAHARCADSCPADASGGIDVACLAACPRGENVVASRSRAAYDTCLTETGAKGCAACPKPSSDPPPFNEVLDQKCGPSTDPTSCGKCEDVNCCNTYAACAAEPECKMQVQPCVVACKTDNKCKEQCYAQHPKGVATWARRNACITVRCVTECGAQPDACYECGVRTTCRETNARCTADEGCFLLRACLDANCPTLTDACITSCKAKSPASSGRLFEAWFSCVAISCAGVCG